MKQAFTTFEDTRGTHNFDVMMMKKFVRDMAENLDTLFRFSNALERIPAAQELLRTISQMNQLSINLRQEFEEYKTQAKVLDLGYREGYRF